MSLSAACGTIASRIAEHGWAVQPEFLEAGEILAWSLEVLDSFRDGAFRLAGVGRGERHRVRPAVREDHVRWLEAPGGTPCERRYFELMELLRLTLNRELTLGLFELEAHLALYPPGARYRCHLDQFQNEENRILSVSLYLNPDWGADDGGALRVYLGEPESEPFEDVLPAGGTLACFLSGRFHHEVLPSRRERLSVTGWFTRRGEALPFNPSA